MAPPRRRLARPIRSQRYLALRHGRSIIKAYEARERSEDDSAHIREDDKLGHQVAQLFSADVPGLQFQTYTIEARQKINVYAKKEGEEPDAQPVTKQDFEVKGPRFALPEDAVYSFYPPEGHSDTVDVLPHVVFNDAEFPWERPGSLEAAAEKKPLGQKDWERNRTPWLAVMAFTPNELALTEAELKDIFAKTSLKDAKPRQTATYAVKMPTKDLEDVRSDTMQLPYQEPFDSVMEPSTSMIFVKPEFFNAAFANYDDAGNPVPRIGSGGQERPTVWQHRFLAHVRSVNTRGMAWADQAEEDIPNRKFSLVVSNRTGPLLPLPAKQPNNPPETQIVAVHVVSIEHVEQMSYPLDANKVKRVGLVSLFSWTFQYLPPGSITIPDALSALGKTSAPLAAPLPSPPPVNQPYTDVQKRMLRRLEDGYTLTKYRVQTGEQTVGLYRGPLTPTSVPRKDWELLSNSGTRLQILDKELGIMDITYSSAWQLGRTLALANRAYSTALTRVRRAILTLAADTSQKSALKLADMSTSASSRLDVVSKIAGVLREVCELSRCHENSDVGGSIRQWEQQEGQIPDLAYDSPGVRLFAQDALDTAARKVASTTDGDPKKGVKPYDEYNTPYSPDWVLVLRFVLDLYHLVDIPLHYLLPNMAQLPIESLRYFVVDYDWIDALVDGALSLGNQGVLSLKGVDKQPADLVRRAIKVAFKDYFDTKNSKLNYKPPVPKFGFFMRSQVVVKFPDLKIDIKPLRDPDGAPILLRHNIIGSDTMLGLFNELHTPEGRLETLTFTLPPHQQSFSAGRSVTPDDITVSYKRIYTEAGHDDDANRQVPVQDKLVWKKEVASTRPAVFRWETKKGEGDVHLVLIENFANDLYLSLRAALPTGFVEICPTSAMMAFQLNAPAWQLLTNLTGKAPTSHLLTYPADPLHALQAATSRVPRWPAKQAVSRILAEDEEDYPGPGLKHLASPAYTKRLLPTELVFDDSNSGGSNSDCFSDGLADSSETDPDYMHSDSDFEDVSLVSASRSNGSISHELDTIGENSDPRGSRSSRRGVPASTFADNKPVLPHSSHHPQQPPAQPGWRWKRRHRHGRQPGHDISVMAGTPLFSCSVRPASNPSSTRVPLLATRQDLVFSIIYMGDGNKFQLSSIKIVIPLKGSKTTDDWLARTPPAANRAFMVSNLRFNVAVTYSRATSNLEMVIVPRTWQDFVPVDEMLPGVTDVSVVLVGVNVRTDRGNLNVPCTVTPYYRNSNTREIECDIYLRKDAS